MITNTKNLSIAARALAIGVVAALVLAGTAMGKCQELDLLENGILREMRRI